MVRRKEGKGSPLDAPNTSSVPPEQPPNSDAQRKKYVEPPKSEPQRSKWLSGHPLPENVGLNSQNGFTYDARSPRPMRAHRRKSRLERLERWIKNWKAKLFFRLTIQLLHKIANPLVDFCLRFAEGVDAVVSDSNPSGSDSNPSGSDSNTSSSDSNTSGSDSNTSGSDSNTSGSGPKQNTASKPKMSATRRSKSTESEPYIKTFKLELIDKKGHPVIRNVQVLLDTGNPRNILSSKLVKLFNLGFEDDRERVALKTIGNNEWLSIGRIKGRFIFKSSDPSWIDAEFEVSKCVEHFDAVIGSKSLNEYKMVKVSEDVPHAFSGFRGKCVCYTKEEISKREEEQKKIQQENEARKTEALKKASAAKTPSSNSSSSSQ